MLPFPECKFFFAGFDSGIRYFKPIYLKNKNKQKHLEVRVSEVADITTQRKKKYFK